MKSSLYHGSKIVRLLEREERAEKRTRTFSKFLKSLRIVTYALLCLLVLSSNLISKGSLINLTSELGHFEINSSREQEIWTWVLVFTVSAPYALSFLVSTWNFVFRQSSTPSLLQFAIGILLSAVNSIGTGIFVFGVFPKLDVPRSILLMSAVYFVPSSFQLFQSVSISFNQSTTTIEKVSHILNLTVGVICSLGQFSVFFIVLLSDFKSDWEILVGLILVSLSSNVIFFNLLLNSRRQNSISKIVNKLRAFNENLQLAHQKIGLVSNLIKIGVIFLIAYIYQPKFVSNTDLFDAKNSADKMKYLTPLVVQLASSLVCYLCCLLAFELKMSRLGFALPLTFSAPLALLLSVILCQLSAENKIDFKNKFLCAANYSLNPYKWHLIVGSCLWLASSLWATRHIWSTRLQELKLSSVNSVFLESSLMLSVFRNRGESLDEKKEAKIDESTVLYICATMWHESKHEMVQLLKSIMRLDIEQSEKKTSLEYEAHIFFDDAIAATEANGSEPNNFVQNLVCVIDEAAAFAYKREVRVEAAQKTLTPYGGRLTFKLPGGNSLFVHLKDKAKIRNKKRWSQVMYMYYLLGYKYFSDLSSMEKHYNQRNSEKVASDFYFTGFGSLLNSIDSKLRVKLENTFILTLDGDVTFRPDAVQLMLDKIRENPKIGSVCGRVHPIGSGPIVWYQIFEYAVGHWLQKVTEHIFGTVMCSPGCFSLLRGSTILEDQILNVYSTLSTEASHYVQYDQGEDRWLSTLIVQQGYYIVYCSAADSYTYCPETFKEYFNQRRRWIPSTMANLIDFLKDYRHILRVNKRLTWLFVAYILVNFVASLLGPSTVLLMLADTFQVGFGMGIWGSYLLAVSPAVLYLVASFYLSNDAQIKLASVLSCVLGLTMVAILVGAVSRALNSSIIGPTSLIVLVLLFVFLVSAALHPTEFKCLFPGVLYFLALPAAFVLLNMYAIINLNNVSWGTREAKSGSLQTSQSPSFFASLFSRLFKANKQTSETNNTLASLVDSIERLDKKLNAIAEKILLKNGFKEAKLEMMALKNLDAMVINLDSKDDQSVAEKETKRVWLDHACLKHCEKTSLDGAETKFFEALIEKHLQPVRTSALEKEAISADLRELRNKCCLGFMMLNALWLVFLFSLQLLQDKLRDKVYIAIWLYTKQPMFYEPISFLFVMLFVAVLCMQFLAMLWHRSLTFMQLLRNTTLTSRGGRKQRRSNPTHNPISQRV